MSKSNVVELFHAQNHIVYLASKQTAKEIAVLNWRAINERSTLEISKSLLFEATRKREEFEKSLKIAFPNSQALWAASLEGIDREVLFYISQLEDKVYVG